jgi:hypothetical protein
MEGQAREGSVETRTVVPASEAPTERFDWPGSLFRPLILSCHVIFSSPQSKPTQSLANTSDIVCLAAGRLRAVCMQQE